MRVVISGPAVLEANGTATPAAVEARQEPEKIRKWREEQKKMIEQKGEFTFSFIAPIFFSQIEPSST